MSCLTTLIMSLVSRIVIIFWWFTDPSTFNLAFRNWVIPGSVTIPTWIWPVLGFIFLPWTTIAYLFLYPGGIVGYEWVVIGVALLIDLAGHGGGYRHRNRWRRRN